MKKFFVLLVCVFINTFCFSQSWNMSENIIDKVTGETETVYTYNFSDIEDEISCDVMLKPHVIRFNINGMFSNFNVNIWSKTINSKCSVNIYNENKKKIKTLNNVKLFLGSITENPMKNVATLTDTLIIKYLCEQRGIVSFTFSTMNGEKTIIVPCVNNEFN